MYTFFIKMYLDILFKFRTYCANDRNRAFLADQAVYCNGVKCAAYEKCQYDRNAKREKCTRA